MLKTMVSTLSFLLLLCLALAVVQAQEALTQTYTPPDGSFSVMYPAGWTADDSYMAAGFIQFSSGAPIAVNDALAPLVSGDMGVALFVLPNTFLTQMRLAGDTIQATVSSLSTALGHPASTLEDFALGSFPAVRGVTSSSDNDSEIIGVDLGNGTAIIALGLTFKGELATLDATMLAMLATASIGGSSSAPVSETETAVTARPEAVTNAVSVDMTAANAVELGETFTAADGSFSMRYPSGLVFSTQSDFPRFTTENAPKTSADPFVAGSISITLELAPLTASLGVSGDDIHDYLASFLEVLNSPAPNIEDLMLGSHPAARAVNSTADFDREIIGVDFGNGQKIMLYGATFTGELATLDATMLAMLESIQVGVAAPSPTPATTAVPTTTLSLQPALLWTDDTFGFPAAGLAFSADDTTLLVGSPLAFSNAGTELTLADAATGNALFSPLTGLQRAPGKVAFSPDGSTVAGFDSEAVIVWDAASNVVTASVPMRQYEFPTDMDYNPVDGALLYITQADPEDTLWQLDLATGQAEALYTVTDRNNVLQGMALSPDGSSVLVGVKDYTDTLNAHATVYQIDLASHEATMVFDQAGVDQVALLYPAQGQPVLAVNPRDTYTTQVWDITSNQLLYTLPEAQTQDGITVGTLRVAINPAGTILATGSISVEAQLWDAKTGAPLGTLDRNLQQMQNSEPYGFAFTHQGNGLAVFYGNRQVSLWSLDGSGASTAATTATGAASPTEAPTVPPTTADTTAAACTITASGGANLRSGAGTTFAVAGSLAAGASQSVLGQAMGGDGFVWWKLESGSWVRSDLVTTDGDCPAVPTAAS